MTTLEKIKAEIEESRYGLINDGLDVALKIIDKYAEQKPCDDAISRQAVLNTLDDMDNVLDEDRTVENYKELLKECYEVLPSVRPQEQTGMSDAVLEHYRKLAEHYNGGTHESIQDTNDGK